MATVDIWLVVGTRRWARLMARELCAALPDDTVLYMRGDPVDAELQAWLATSGLGMKIQVGLVLPPCPGGATGVAFVVNSACMHKFSVEEMLNAGYNVVCEKPMSFSRQETLSLIDMAAALGLQLFCTNTYLFATYLDRFRKDWLVGRRFTSLHVSWADPVKEVRFGEAKCYDSSVPLIYDVLPHIANIALATYGEFQAISQGIEVRRGGSEVSIHYRHGKFDIYIALQRNAQHRRRTIAFAGPDNNVMLDFSTEPGSVFVDQMTPVPTDTVWLCKPKPIAAMICSVQKFFESGKKDPRLSPYASLLGNELIDCVSDSYAAQQISLLTGRGKMSDTMHRLEDLNYAGKEVISIAARALPYLSEESPLRKLASAANPLNFPT
jgi:hypothetical protein